LHTNCPDAFLQEGRADLPAGGRTGRPASGRQARWSIIIFMIYYVYAIKSEARKYIYVGISDDPERRVKQHNNGKERTTRPYIPFKILLIEKYNSRPEARIREKYLKSGIGKDFLYSLV
jgi:putative endonuclease